MPIKGGGLSLKHNDIYTTPTDAFKAAKMGPELKKKLKRCENSFSFCSVNVFLKLDNCVWVFLYFYPFYMNNTVCSIINFLFCP